MPIKSGTKLHKQVKVTEFYVIADCGYDTLQECKDKIDPSWWNS